MKNGRVLVYMPNHPNSRKNGIYVRRSHLIMSKYLGRPIKMGEVVHHKNCNPADDRIKNLELMTISEHRSWHMKNGQAKRMREMQLIK